MKGKRTPTYDLSEIQRLVRLGDPNVIIRGLARDEAMRLGYDSSDIFDCICRLNPAREPAGDFYKSMPAEHPRAAAAGLWQDVYRPTYGGVVMYVKVQITAGKAVVINFKER